MPRHAKDGSLKPGLFGVYVDTDRGAGGRSIYGAVDARGVDANAAARCVDESLLYYHYNNDYYYIVIVI